MFLYILYLCLLSMIYCFKNVDFLLKLEFCLFFVLVFAFRCSFEFTLLSRLLLSFESCTLVAHYYQIVLIYCFDIVFVRIHDIVMNYFMILLNFNYSFNFRI